MLAIQPLDGVGSPPATGVRDTGQELGQREITAFYVHELTQCRFTEMPNIWTSFPTSPPSPILRPDLPSFESQLCYVLAVGSGEDV